MIASARRLLLALQQAVRARGDICIIAPGTIVQAAPGAEQIVATLDGAAETGCSARLLVIADGVESQLRTDAGIGTTRHDYQRTAICCALRPERDHGGTAYERFTRNGPVALLPQSGGRCGAVYVVPTEVAPRLLSLSDADFLRELQDAVGYRLGRLRHAGERVAYPLRRVIAERLTAPRQVLIGNAAQAVHPVGAQGFNLGVRDAATLAERLLAAHRAAQDPGAERLLESYAQARAADRAATTGLSHALALGTSPDLAPARWLRSVALLAADRIAPVREHLQLGGMGFRGATPQLARTFP